MQKYSELNTGLDWVWVKYPGFDWVRIARVLIRVGLELAINLNQHAQISVFRIYNAWFILQVPNLIWVHDQILNYLFSFNFLVYPKSEEIFWTDIPKLVHQILTVQPMFP